jgi:hypothetical protein
MEATKDNMLKNGHVSSNKTLFTAQAAGWIWLEALGRKY